MKSSNFCALKLIVAALFSATITVPITSMAATEAEKRAAIDSGLSYLAGTQLGNGSWNISGGTPDDTAATGAALLAFLEEKDNWAADYSAVVSSGLNYVFNQAQPFGIGLQPHGDPDSNGNGIGVKFVLGDNNSRATYTTGLVAPALAKTGTPNAIVTVGSQTGRTYSDVLTDVVDYFAYGQNDGGSGRGGWRYYANSGSSDNSTAQWPAVASLYAEGTMGIHSPDFVKDELAVWIEYIQNTSGGALNGGSGYEAPGNIVNESKTGGLLVEMVVAEDDTQGVAFDTNHPRVQAALAYLDRNWRDEASGTWYGNFKHPYAMWSVYKGLESMIGKEDTTWIKNLHDQGTASIDPGDTWNWWEDYNESLVSTQNTNGSWGGYSYWSTPLATAWNINILAGTEAEKPEIPEIPEPGILALMSIGLVGLLSIRRRTQNL